MELAKLEDVAELEPATIVKLYAEDKLGFDLIDSLNAASHLEVTWLVRVHDYLHREYDWDLRYRNDSNPDEVDRTPRDVYKLHATLHDLADAKGFRGSFINGELDGFDSKGGSSTSYLAKSVSDSEDKDLVAEVQTIKDIVMSLANQLNPQSEENQEGSSESTEQETQDEATNEPSADADPTTEDQEEQKEEQEQEGLLADEDDFVQDEDIDWALLDWALDGLMGDAKLSTEQRKKLSKGTFCGPDRSFPVPDCAHVTAARRLVGRAKLSSDQKAKVLACVSRKAKSLGCESESEDHDCRCNEYDALHEDYAEALKTIDLLKSKLELVLDAHAKSANADISDEEGTKRLDLLVNWFDNVDQTVEKGVPTPDDVKPVENPADSAESEQEVAASHEKSNLEDLGDFERETVERFKKILQDEGQEAADRFFRSRAKYMPRNFDLQLLLS